jgi:hypothetical protein
MSAHLSGQLATTTVKSAAAHMGAELPTQSRSLQTADFERLMAQAHEQRAQVQLTNPVGEMGQRGLQEISKAMGTTSHNYRTSLQDGRAAMSNFDVRDPASVVKVSQHFMDIAARGTELSLMLSVLTTARKSFGELLKNQG